VASPPPDFAPHEPFALFPDGERGTLLTHPVAILEARTPGEIGPLLDDARALLAAGHHLAGGIAYEAGAAFEPGIAPSPAPGPLLWLAAFSRCSAVRLSDILPEDRPARFGAPRPRIAREQHGHATGHLRDRIAAGDIYQANLCFQADVPVSGHPLALFREAHARAPAAHAALVHTGSGWWLSLSPELFFELEGRTLHARPMKGTAPRGRSDPEDRALADALAADPKNRAENLMITDLIRNDLARVSVAGSVTVPALFEVRAEPYVHQMTSTVAATLADGLDAFDALAALFPCGSITGAPKIRAVATLAETEWGPRGLYCGSLFRLSGDRATFSIAIRTLVLEQATAPSASLGLGSGIVWDSVPDDEWAECLAKARFLERQAPETLIETMRREPDGTVPRLPLHLERMAASARRFGFPFDCPAIAARLASLAPAPSPQRVRLLLGRSGAVALQVGPAPAPPAGPVEIARVPLPVPPSDWRLAHKTGARDFYDAARAAAAMFEVVFLREDGFATEGSFTSLFVESNGVLLTPPLSHGLLPGVLREALLRDGRAREAPIDASAIAQASEEGRLFIGNSLRGLLAARCVA
jgi:para-aminobenzoate synthetase/4-amino-4-deoxychorismate lyase